MHSYNSSSLFNFSSLYCVDDNLLCGISIFLSCDNKIYSFGKSSYGSHGHKETIILKPKVISNFNNITNISCGLYHTVCLDNFGNIYSFGSNYYEQLGIGKDYNSLQYSYIPLKIDVPFIKQISCASYFTICLTKDNILYSFGNNSNGHLGLDNNNKYLTPQKITAINNIEHIECGGFHVMCKNSLNDYYSWGHNSYGQLGQECNEIFNTPIKCINWPSNIIDIKCGDYHTLLLTSEGKIYSCGSNTYGQLGINDKNIKILKLPTLIKDIPEIKKIECGYFHSMCIDINDNLWVFGKNEYGQLGLGDKEKRFKPILHPILKNISTISSGGCHTIIKTLDNKIYSCGSNKFAQIGIKTSKTYQEIPVEIFIEDTNI